MRLAWVAALRLNMAVIVAAAAAAEAEEEAAAEIPQVVAAVLMTLQRLQDKEPLAVSDMAR